MSLQGELGGGCRGRGHRVGRGLRGVRAQGAAPVRRGAASANLAACRPPARASPRPPRQWVLRGCGGGLGSAPRTGAGPGAGAGRGHWVCVESGAEPRPACPPGRRLKQGRGALKKWLVDATLFSLWRWGPSTPVCCQIFHPHTPLPSHRGFSCGPWLRRTLTPTRLPAPWLRTRPLRQRRWRGVGRSAGVSGGRASAARRVIRLGAGPAGLGPSSRLGRW